MLWLFRYLLGYVTVKISGDYAYEIINLSARNGIPIYSFRYVKGYVIGNISVKNFKKLRIVKRKCKGNIKILKKTGIPFITNRYKGRYGIILGVLIFFLMLKVMSGFIWNIDVIGNERLSYNDIIFACNKIGIFEGSKIDNIDTLNSAQRLLLENKELAWASFNIENCNLTVNVTEVKEKDKNNIISNLIASDTGIVEKIDVSSGNVLVKTQQKVTAGDVLVSGVIEKADSTVFVPSNGKIFASQDITLTYKEKAVQKLRLPENTKIYRNSLQIFGIKIPLSFGNTKGCKKINNDCKQLSLFNKKLPLYLYSTEFRPQKTSVIKFSKAELLAKIEKKSSEDIKKLNAVSVTETAATKMYSNGELTVSKTFTVVRNIAVKKEIIIDSNN